MLSRVFSKPSSLRFLALISSSESPCKHHHPPPIQIPSSSTFFSIASRYFSSRIPSSSTFFSITSRYFSSSRGNNDSGSKSSDFWKISSENEESIESVFGEDTGSLEGIVGGEDAVRKPKEEESWFSSESKEKGGGNEEEHDIFKVIESEGKGSEASGINDKWKTGEGFKDWNLVVGDQKDGEAEEIFDIGDGGASELAGLDGNEEVEGQKKEEDKLLEIEEKALSEILKGIPFITCP